MTQYKLSSDAKGQSLIVVYDEEDPVTVPGTHPKFDEILGLLRTGNAGDEEVRDLVNLMYAVGRKLSSITERISMTAYGVFFDGDPLRSELAEIISDMADEGRTKDLSAVAMFLENAAANQSMESIDMMYRWITNGDLVLTSKGTFLAYKGTALDGGGNVTSISTGTALVDGVEYAGRIPNPIGAVITMPRSNVTDDSAVGCGPGLHAGTYSYASSFGHRGAPLLRVEINPRDVVSVPSDSSFQKLRVSRYKVIDHVDRRTESRFHEFVEDPSEIDDGDFTEVGEVDEQQNTVDNNTEEQTTENKDEQSENKDTVLKKLGKWFLDG